jgi:hypothetical protein
MFINLRSPLVGQLAGQRAPSSPQVMITASMRG